MRICPECNSIYEPTFCCSNCSNKLRNEGRVEDYLGPYSADMPIEDKYYCSHYYKCTNCGMLQRYDIKMINY